MRTFMDEDFLLYNETAKILYHEYAKNMPIYDYHNHLSAKEIYEDNTYENITKVWLLGDHYKWRLMRANGYTEDFITGDADDYEKFAAWADTLENAIGNPLYHWSHLELKRYFGITKTLSKETCKEIWYECNKKLSNRDLSVKNLLKKQNVHLLCTTNDPIEDLEYHFKLKEIEYEIKVLPTFRPDKVYFIGKDEYPQYIKLLGESASINIDNTTKLKAALKKRLDFFLEAGCMVSDHSLEGMIYMPSTDEEAEMIFQKKRSGKSLSKDECLKFQGNILVYLGRLYADKGIAMQYHIGAMRNNSTRMYKEIGPDTGYDSADDFNIARELSGLLNEMDRTDELPKTILYSLNSKDYEALAGICGDFQSAPYKGKMQLGAPWWMCDHKRGIEYHLSVLEQTGLLSVFIGMLTDSRSFLSFPRHEYFRRILCNKIGGDVESGEYPADMKRLRDLIENICYYNVKRYFLL